MFGCCSGSCKSRVAVGIGILTATVVLAGLAIALDDGERKDGEKDDGDIVMFAALVAGASSSMPLLMGANRKGRCRSRGDDFVAGA
ncbi:MAG: hypothetical protein AAFR38_14010 [Planctomycetota bacterium]